MKFIYTNILLLILISGAFNLTCKVCNQNKCRAREELDCPGIVVADVCACCNVCAQQEGDGCGGVHNMGGTCDRGLACMTDPIDSQAMGICIKVPVDEVKNHKMKAGLAIKNNSTNEVHEKFKNQKKN